MEALKLKAVNGELITSSLQFFWKNFGSYFWIIGKSFIIFLLLLRSFHFHSKESFFFLIFWHESQFFKLNISGEKSLFQSISDFFSLLEKWGKYRVASILGQYRSMVSFLTKILIGWESLYWVLQKDLKWFEASLKSKFSSKTWDLLVKLNTIFLNQSEFLTKINKKFTIDRCWPKTDANLYIFFQ
jgi:hypothetical protein